MLKAFFRGVTLERAVLWGTADLSITCREHNETPWYNLINFDIDADYIGIWLHLQDPTQKKRRENPSQRKKRKRLKHPALQRLIQNHQAYAPAVLEISGGRQRQTKGLEFFVVRYAFPLTDIILREECVVERSSEWFSSIQNCVACARLRSKWLCVRRRLAAEHVVNRSGYHSRA